MGAGGPTLGKSTKTTARGSSNSGTWSGLLLVLLLLSLHVLAPGLGMINQHHHDDHHTFDDLIHESYDMLLRGFTSSAVASHERTLRPETTKHEDLERFLGNELESLLDRSPSISPSSILSNPRHITALRQARRTSTVNNDKYDWLVDAALGKLHSSDRQLSNDQSILTIPPVTSDSLSNSAATTARKQMERSTGRAASDNSQHILVLQPSTSCADCDKPHLPTVSEA